MNMLTSLKALLFAMPGTTAVKAGPAPTDAAPDFAHLLNVAGHVPAGHGPAAALPDMPHGSAIPAAVDMADAAPESTPVRQIVTPEIPPSRLQAQPDATGPAKTETPAPTVAIVIRDARDRNLPQPASAVPDSDGPAFLKSTDGMIDPVAPRVAPEVEEEPLPALVPSDPSPVAAHPAQLHHAARVDAVNLSRPVKLPDAPDVEAPSPSTGEAAGLARDAVQPELVAAPSIIAPPISFTPPPTPARTETVGPEKTDTASTPIVSARGIPQITIPAPQTTDAVKPQAALSAIVSANSPSPTTDEPVPVSKDNASRDVAPSSNIMPMTDRSSSVAAPASLVRTDGPAVPVVSAPTIAMTSPAGVAPGAVVAPIMSREGATPDPQPVAMPDLPQENAPATPARAEAVSLLQLVRDHMGLRSMRSMEGATPPSAPTPVRHASADPGVAILPTAVNDSATPLASPMQATAQPVAIATTAVPAIDLSASLGAQMVDMGVSGQWIDGLAREIAGLSVNGAQGRFQVTTDQLGPIQIDIRQGDDGAAVSLTVATEAAERVLRQEGDRLKLDAGLSAVRISDVKVERAPPMAETARADAGGNQPASQQSSGGGGQGQHQGQAMGQSSTQSHMQGRGQQRENIAFGHKAGNDAAVLNHMDAGAIADGAVHARYA